jgi:exodeoxyribonuclease VII large subunit
MFFSGKSMNWIKVTINGRELNVGFDDSSIHVYNAFPVKDDLKLRGYRWDPADKSWFVTPSNIEDELEVLKNNLRTPAPLPRPGKLTDLSAFPESYSVIELRNRIDGLIRNGIGGSLWVRGVIASEVKSYEWASYFDLKDEDEQSDVFFRAEIQKNNLLAVNKKLGDLGVAETISRDLPVFCQVEIRLSTRNVVDIRLKVRDILPEYTQARIRSQRDITVEKLMAEGILENQKKLKLPAIITRLGLITSELGTSVQDVLAGLGPYQNRYFFYFLDTRMEGSAAVHSILDSIDRLETRLDVPLDAIVITRGGGSEQSLAVFNDFGLCRRICRCRIPVLTAIGHEKDLSAAEICSFFTPTPSTPSGMGKYLQDRFVNLQTRLGDTVRRLVQVSRLMRSRENEKLAAFLQLIPSQAGRFLKFRNEQFFARIRQFGQSASFLVKNQESEILNRVHFLEKMRGIIRRSFRQDVFRIMALLPERMALINRRESRQLGKIISRLDTKKLARENRIVEGNTLNLARTTVERGRKYIMAVENNLVTRLNLARASDPDRILKKGFTLTLDKQNRVIPTLKRFQSARQARLKFQDGIIDIIRKEET